MLTVSIYKQKKVTQEALGKKLGISGDIIGRYERDDVTPSVEVASKQADVLDVSIDYILKKIDSELDSATVGRILEISVMPEGNKKTSVPYPRCAHQRL